VTALLDHCIPSLHQAGPLRSPPQFLCKPLLILFCLCRLSEKMGTRVSPPFLCSFPLPDKSLASLWRISDGDLHWSPAESPFFLPPFLPFSLFLCGPRTHAVDGSFRFLCPFARHSQIRFLPVGSHFLRTVFRRGIGFAYDHVSGRSWFTVHPHPSFPLRFLPPSAFFFLY